MPPRGTQGNHKLHEILMDTIDIAANIVAKNNEIESLTFCKYKQRNLVQEEMNFSDTERNFLEDALCIRKKYRVPFWDSLMISFFDKKNVPYTLLERALVHNKNVEKIKTKDTESIRMYLKNNPNDDLSLNSEVIMRNGDIKHFFLLDFHIYPSDNNLKIISNVLRLLGVHGYVLCSGESYHFVSNSLYDIECLINMLAKSLLFSPIVDRSWIAHQIIERSCSLRVGIKHDVVPTVIKEII